MQCVWALEVESVLAVSRAVVMTLVYGNGVHMYMYTIELVGLKPTSTRTVPCLFPYHSTQKKDPLCAPCLVCSPHA